MTRFQFFIALFCAEWLVIFRTWLAPSVLLTLVVIAGFRLYKPRQDILALPHFW